MTSYITLPVNLAARYGGSKHSQLQKDLDQPRKRQGSRQITLAAMVRKRGSGKMWKIHENTMFTH